MKRQLPSSQLLVLSGRDRSRAPPMSGNGEMRPIRPAAGRAPTGALCARARDSRRRQLVSRLARARSSYLSDN